MVPSKLMCFPISLSIAIRATLVLPAPCTQTSGKLKEMYWHDIWYILPTKSAHRWCADKQVLIRVHGGLEKLALDAVQGFEAFKPCLGILGQFLNSNKNLVGQWFASLRTQTFVNLWLVWAVGPTNLIISKWFGFQGRHMHFFITFALFAEGAIWQLTALVGHEMTSLGERQVLEVQQLSRGNWLQDEKTAALRIERRCQ